LSGKSELVAQATNFLFIFKNQEKPVHLPKNLIHIPLVRQGTNWTCGVAAFQSVLYAFANEEWREDRLAEKLKANPKDGTDHREMISFARELGLFG
jgi:predicted double-glycine peptidase